MRPIQIAILVLPSIIMLLIVWWDEHSKGAS